MNDRELARFEAKYEVAPSGCWTWIAARNHYGYGQFWKDGKPQYAHRVSYEHHKGPIPDGFQVDHLCRVRNCVNPEHLEVVTQRENNRRSGSPSAKNMLKTHCYKGHPLDGENLYVDPKGQRYCRVCRREVDRRRTERARAARQGMTSEGGGDA